MSAHSDPPESAPESWDVDALWERVRARTIDGAQAADVRAKAPAPRARPRRIPRWVYFNAASLLLAGIAGTWIARSHNRNTTAAASTEPGEYRTSRGQYATIRLADSTAVTLAPESHLTVSARFADGVREISLEGEAIFNVRHDALHPFRVRTHGALVEDVGTRFDLRAYPDDAEVTVAVAEGSVSLGVDSAAAPATPAHRSPATVVLRGGDVGMLGTQGTVASEHSPSVAGYLGWADGRLSFVDRPLPEVLRTIARWYDLDLRVDDAQLARRLVTADFVRQSASQMIDALAVAMDATVERRGRIVTLRPR